MNENPNPSSEAELAALLARLEALTIPEFSVDHLPIREIAKQVQEVIRKYDPGLDLEVAVDRSVDHGIDDSQVERWTIRLHQIPGMELLRWVGDLRALDVVVSTPNQAWLVPGWVPTTPVTLFSRS